MNARPFVVAGVLAALAMPAAVAAKPIPNQNHVGSSSTKRVAKGVTGRSRVLCICIVRTTPWPGAVTAAMSRDAFERQYDEDMVAHSLEPVYGTARPPDVALPIAAG